ncbi:succinate dehydrogenase, hydrophobic membrane anchor protein [Amphibiibacter pelophylacis]|uniref:Succinate dehydrogenase, hydrophobic membrane anchor protein n=1 Tax=Amphibiibacter pelophylacis TaxID=1799477 RepID=A0ACC6P2X1_9BURK
MSATGSRVGAKRLVVGAHYGLRDWLAQRLTAVLMVMYTVVLGAQMLFAGPLDYDTWAGIFAPQWMKFLTFVVAIALFCHVWVGVRDIWMDYVKPVSVRLFLHVFTLVWLLGCTGWLIQVLWRI